jgi:chemotaxis protein methyltransferase CheR
MTRQSIYTPVMDGKTFNRIRQLVYNLSGISLSDNKESLVKARISKRMRNLDIDDYEQYFEYVINDPSGMEIQILVDSISTNTTSFYREADHFEFFRNIVKNWIDQGRRSLRIWCTASSTGEEPYTMAIELNEAIATFPYFDAKILATDINTNVLRTAQAGVFTEERVTPIPKHLLTKYFTKMKNDDRCVYAVSDQLKKLVIYRQFNLTDQPYPVRSDLDVIFCRNVMIYFDGELRRMMAGEFERILKSGGYLIVGHAESLTGMSKSLRCIKPSIYKKE